MLIENGIARMKPPCLFSGVFFVTLVTLDAICWAQLLRFVAGDAGSAVTSSAAHGNNINILFFKFESIFQAASRLRSWVVRQSSIPTTGA